MARRRDASLAVFVLGAGKVGTSLARALRAEGVRVTLRAARKGPPRAIDADVVVLAVRDRELTPLAAKLVGVVSRRSVAVHVAGALGPEALSPLRGACAGVAQMHPMISFASTRFAPSLLHGNVHIQGDPPAVARARRLARLLGMTPRTVSGLDTVAYHAAAGLVANGAAALAAVGAELLVKAGVPRREAAKMLGPLVRSVADNVEALGFPEALTGPVRRGDAAGVEKHLKTLHEKLPYAVDLYLAAARAQLPLARAIGDASDESLDAVARVLDAAKG
ncbi:MAG TPA: Rossmann-like and DUF2520 domain-containing protein [Polyangiaceae bacterium]|jgi:predicted short-subunit dehydrogenase-like oxidoreductase (DUF2520 family)